MSHNVPETDTFPPVVTVPDSFDARTALSVSEPMASLANRTRYLKNRVTVATPTAGGTSIPTPGDLETIDIVPGGDPYKIEFSALIRQSLSGVAEGDRLLVVGSVNITKVSSSPPPLQLLLGDPNTGETLGAFGVDLTDSVGSDANSPHVSICSVITVPAASVPTITIAVGFCADATAQGVLGTGSELTILKVATS